VFHTGEQPPNKACTGRLGLCEFFGDCSELWQFSVSELVSPQPPVTHTVRRRKMDEKRAAMKKRFIGAKQKEYR
jgi:hypothetical protein